MKRFDEFTKNGKILALLYMCVLIVGIGLSLNYIVTYTDSHGESVAQSDPLNADETDRPASADSNQEPNQNLDQDSNQDLNQDSDQSLDQGSDQDSAQDANQDQGQDSAQDSEQADKTPSSDVSSATDEDDQAVGEEETIYTEEDLENLSNAVTTIYFDSQSFSIDQAYEGLLQSFIVLINQYPEESISIEGYANGYPQFNNSNLELTLSQKRIDEVKAYLVEHGAKLNQFESINYGSQRPSSVAEDQQGLNDKVMIYFTDHSPHQGNKK